jgi:error-prone DNA polymerase
MSAPIPYVELHARSAFSFLRGASSPEQLVEVAGKVGLPALALCDRNGVYGAPRAYGAAKENGLRSLVGSELTLEDGSVLPVLVMNPGGYRNLCRLLTQAQLRAPKGESRIAWSELEKFSDGLIALSGDSEGPLHSSILRGERNEAEATLHKMIRAFGQDRLFIELQRHRVPDEELIVEGLTELAKSSGVPLVATNGVQYAEPWGCDVLDVFTCIRHHTHLDAAGLLLGLNTECHLKTAAQMQTLFADVPEALSNTARIADRLEFTLQDLGYAFPEFKVPEGETMDSQLRKLTYFGAQQRYGSIAGPVREQLEKELALITKLGFSGYFLIVWDIVNFAREEGILVQGRGSAANSAVCYSLGITAVDPVSGKLLFERFLAEGRKSWPDIDLDLPSGERREKVIQEVFRRNGKHGAAMTANVITYRGKSAMREIGKALNFSEDILKKFSDLYASGDFEHTLELEEQIIQAGVPRSHDRFRPLIQLYHRIYGLPRHLGQHSGGMVISKGRLDEVVPLENASMPGRVVVQWDKDDCEDLGIIKIDLLGLGMMAVLQDAVEQTHHRGRGVDLAHIPKDDVATFELMQKADTVGTFQIESRAQMATLPRMKPKEFYDVAIEVAIIRPGPIVGQMVHPYLARRNGEEKIEYIHPDLEPVLARTLGVPLFQEQMLRIAMIMADFDGAEAEELRRAISFHRSDEKMKKVVIKLRANMTRKGITKEVQDRIVNALSSFALYGFPESHAISFALLAYASCWLKVHRAPEFYSGLLNNQPMGFYSPASLVRDGKKRGVKFLAVCVVRSGELCTIEENGDVRLGLNYVRGLHRDKAAWLVTERNQRAFSSLEDLLIRVPLNKSERRVLAQIGALNLLSEHRRTALWDIESVFDSDDLFSGQSLEGEKPLEPMNGVERLQADFDGTRVTTGPHMMSYMRTKLSHVTRAVDLVKGKHGSKVVIAGVVICRQRPGTAKGHVFVSLEDETGISNAIVRSELFEKLRLTITHEPFLEIEGRLQHIEGVVSVLAKDVRGLNAPAIIQDQSYDFH